MTPNTAAIRADADQETIARLREALNIDRLVDKFLAWPLPESVCSDLCATKQNYPHRSGTNLLSADEAKKMLEYLLRQALGGELLTSPSNPGILPPQ
ncbi:MAG: hypothetical protein Q7R68_11195 [Nitrospirales bacterium]|nr:hypothetical protein [Nitrospirales bacterium]